MPVSTVVTGTTIESDWGNDVANSINAAESDIDDLETDVAALVTLTTGTNSDGTNYRLSKRLGIVTFHAYGLTAALTIPAGYRPVSEVSAPCVLRNASGDNAIGVVRVTTAGVVTVDLANGSASYTNPGSTSAKILHVTLPWRAA